MTCIFCSLIAGEAPGHVLFRDDQVIAFLSLEGHPLIAPIKHTIGLAGLDEEASAGILLAAKRVADAVRAATNCEGVNLILSDGQAAGQDVFHLHMHVKPRWHGDDVRLTWSTAPVPEDDRTALANHIRTHMQEL
ncbi:HIT domain-containing protein [Alphaproteobacteria bacterium GH1-50]|uniref:HIT domain-containing protein n=1 Tax=Kangsaoukella pontilimi TaxID=2691042 RepID=A0A7C9IFA5_9RHOB|nr:HIT domain-containing protein [Kangsaoukella pontilimi]MXQ07227.1 HIT domain-containing protein [Kangsaoukella pontilimi]